MRDGQIRGDYMLESKALWKFQSDDIDLDLIPKELNLSDVTKQLLIRRNMIDRQEIEAFLNPKLADLISPKLLDGIDRVYERVFQAIETKEKILIYGDYDADGVTATVILLKTLRQLGAECDYYIPNRFTEGYGPNKQAFKRAYNEGFTLLITVDTGISAIEEAAYAKQLGLDLIITDHHEFQDELPDAYAIIHPKLSDNYSFKPLAGVGIAFKLAQHLLGELPEDLLDLVAIGTIADLVPLLGENRILAAHGLKQLEKTTNKGLQALIELCSIAYPIDADDIGFLIGPRINAVGRLQDASLAVDLLMTESVERATQKAEKIQALNSERQQIVLETVKEATAIIETTELDNFIVVAKEGWNEGILGIVASRLVQLYNRPTLVLTLQEENNLLKGSGRSIPAFNLFDNLVKVEDLFENFGGHSQAAGVSLKLDNLESLSSRLNDLVNEQLTEEDFRPLLEISDILIEKDISEKTVQEINQLAPFGMENPKPKLLFESIPYDIRQIGQNKNHLKLQFQTDKGSFEGIGFNMGESYQSITPNTPIKIVGELNINEWNGHRTVQMIMQDMEISERQVFDHRGKTHVDFTPYLREERQQLAIGTYPIKEHTLTNIPCLTYDEIDSASLESLDDLFIVDLPEQLIDLEEIVKLASPKNIHACYHLENSIYLTPFPTREDFRWLYSFINHVNPLQLATRLPQIVQAKDWTEEVVQFMIQVFVELQFVTEKNGQLFINPRPTKQKLQQSEVYQQRLQQIDIEKILYYSDQDTLKQWFFKNINQRI